MSGDQTPTRQWTLRRAVTIVAALLALLPFALYALKDLNTDNNVENWLPADDPHAMVLDWYGQEFGVDHGLLASWQGSTLNDPRVEAFAAALAGPLDEQGRRTQPLKGIDEVRTPREVIRRMVENNVPRAEAIQRSAGLLVGTGPLNVQLTPAGKTDVQQTTDRIVDAAAEELGLLIKPLPPAVDAFYEQAVAAAATADDEGIEADEFSGPGPDDPYPPIPPHDLQLRWNDMVPQARSTQRMRELLAELSSSEGEPLVEETFFFLGAPVAVNVALTEEGELAVNETIAMVRQKAAEVGIPADELHLGGSPVGGAALNESSAKALWNPAYAWWNIPMSSPILMSAIVGLGTALMVLRSVRLAALVILTSLYVALLATALVPASGRNLNMVLLVMPNLMIVLTTSGAIHVANYWRHAAQDSLEGAIDTAVQMAWTPCLLASMTTAIGLTSLLTSVLSPVQEFGAYSAIGCLLSVVAVLWGFPALLRLWRGAPPTAEVSDTWRWKEFGIWLYHHGTWVSLAFLAIFAVSVAGLQHFKTETKVIKYFPEHTRIIQDYRFLEENLAGVVPIDIVISFDETAQEAMDAAERMEFIRSIKAKIAEHPEISGTLALSDFRPPVEKPGEGAPRLTRVRYSRTVHGIEEYLSEASAAADGGLTTHAERSLNMRYTGRQVDIPERAELWRIRAQVAVLSDLDYTVLTDYLDALIHEQLEARPGVTHVVTGMVPLFLRTQQAVLESLIRSFGLAFAVIAVVMMILLRSPLAGVITMLPNLLPVGVVFGLISWGGIPVDIGTMITASVALGIAIDGTLHLLTWFRDGLRRGLSREDSIALGLAHCGPAMWQTSAAIGLGLLMLFTAELLLISRFGWLMSALIGAALLADIVFLPALLSGPLGTLIERNTPAEAPSLADGPEAELTAAQPHAVESR
jgi:uncharacterized protein